MSVKSQQHDDYLTLNVYFQTHRVQKCLQKLLRALHKDRAHAITHYRHVLSVSLEAAEREEPRTLERLNDIDRTVNQSMQMLKR